MEQRNNEMERFNNAPFGGFSPRKRRKRRLFTRVTVFAEITVISVKYTAAISRLSQARSNYDQGAN